jgi:N-acyl-D-amino-acid deacylase
MKKINIYGLMLFLFFGNFILKESVVAERKESIHRDPKANAFIFCFDMSGSSSSGEELSFLKGELTHIFSSGKKKSSLTNINLGFYQGEKDKKNISAKIINHDAVKENRLGAVIHIKVIGCGEESPGVNIGVFHYPFNPIASEKIKSPEYTFKFSSDSALLAIHLDKNISKKNGYMGNVELKLMEYSNPWLPESILKKSVNLTILKKNNLTENDLSNLAKNIFSALNGYFSDDSFHVIGVLPQKVRRHCNVENTEIRIMKYIYPDKQLSEDEEKKREEEISKIIETVRPFKSWIYYVSGLEHLSPYSFSVINNVKDKSDFLYELYDGSFLSSSIQGIVRTVPNQIENYTPLENYYSEPRKSASPVKMLDYIITGATIIDGTLEAPGYCADLGILGERIEMIGHLKGIHAKVFIDGSGLFLTPGFIDIHSHADWNIQEVKSAPSHIQQGITTVLGGNCSFSPLGIGSFYMDVEEKGAPLNIGMLIGNRPVRKAVLGRKKGMPPYSAVYRQKELIDLAMEEGAFGMSSGLIYSISEEAFAFELAELAKQLKPYGGFYASHVRGETDEVLDAVRECIYIGEIAEVPVQVSHMKVINKRNWGGMKRYLEIMKSARARGLDVTGDQYPWLSTGPAAHYRLYRLLVREAIRRESPEVVVLKDMPGKYEKYSGRPLPELLEGENITAEELIKDLNLNKKSEIFASYFCLSEEDVVAPMKENFVMVCTDSSLVSEENINSPDYINDHPRKFRTYPEFFGKYVRDKKVCSWELGVYKCTGLPARKMKLKDRGIIRPGAYADLVLFDPEKIDAGTDYRNQSIQPKGINWVFINGCPVLEKGKIKNKKPGKALRAYGYGKP